MNELALEEIRNQAKKFQKEGAIWHVHFLTPECQLNTTGRYTTLLECPSRDYIANCFHETADKTLVGELTQMLHDINLKIDENKQLHTDVSNDGKKIIAKAQILNDRDIKWHHHMLFPDCHFNSYKPNWTLMLENPESDEILISCTENEPKQDLKLLEPLFYANK